MLWLLIGVFQQAGREATRAPQLQLPQQLGSARSRPQSWKTEHPENAWVKVQARKRATPALDLAQRGCYSARRDCCLQRRPMAQPQLPWLHSFATVLWPPATCLLIAQC